MYCIEHSGLPYGEINKLPYGEINKLPYGEINKLPYGEINKLPYGEINKLLRYARNDGHWLRRDKHGARSEATKSIQNFGR